MKPVYILTDLHFLLEMLQKNACQEKIHFNVEWTLNFIVGIFFLPSANKHITNFRVRHRQSKSRDLLF